jgi:hypothetical protein
LAPDASPESIAEKLESVGLDVVSIEPDRAIVGFRDDQDLSQLRRAIDTYEAGPKSGVNPKTQKPYRTTAWDIVEYIDADKMRLWTASDRIGLALAKVIGTDGSLLDTNAWFTVEIDVWHRGTKALAEAGRNEVEQVVRACGSGEERVLDSYVGDSACMVKAAIRGSTLKKLLDLAIISEIELPPAPVLDPLKAGRVDKHSFPKPPRPDLDGPRVCIIDSGIASGHPLLANNVGHEEAILPTGASATDQHGHGTQVAGVAVFGSVRACYEGGVFESPIVLFSARVLNEDNRFDDEKLILNQMRDAIRVFKRPPHDCRVFNLSLGTREPADTNKQSPWAEALDILAREEQVLLVVSAGNNHTIFTNNPLEAEMVLKKHPQQLLQPEARLADPATAAIPLTVGALVEHASVGVRHGVASGDIVKCLGKVAQPSPFTRVGPGLADSVKPDFVDFGGNVVWQGTGNSRREIRAEPGVSVMSFAREYTKGLFAFDVGTSYAAPRVARTAALVWQRLRHDLGREPHPNLVRAVLATAASVPEASRRLIEEKLGVESVTHVCGYGQVDPDFALTSSDRRVTLVAQDVLKLDHFRIYEVPTPEEFKTASGSKVITVALAFDPPVRRRRMDYLGVHMNFMLIRGKTAEEIASAYRKMAGEKNPPPAFKTPYRVTVEPAQTTGPARGTLQRGEFRFHREDRKYGETLHLVVRAERRWAPEVIESQAFAVAVTLEADDPQLYSRLRARLRARARGRA